MANESIAVLLTERNAEKMFPNTVINLIEGGVGVFGNIVVLIMYTKYIADKSGSRYFIPILALVDLFGCLSNVIEYHLDNTMMYTYPSVALCKMILFLMILTAGFSAHLIFSIALQRYLMICRPLGPQMTKRFCRIAIVVILGVSFGYSAPVLKFANLYERMTKFNSGNSSRYITLLYCHFDDKIESSVMVPYFGTLLFLTFINIIATSGLYIPVTRAIYRTLLTSNVQGKEHGNKPATSHRAEQTATQETSRKQKARKRISVMFLVIIIVYVVSYMTSLVTQIHTFVNPMYLTGLRLNIYYFFLRFNLLNHIANPYIYWFYDVKFRKELRRLCCGRFQSKQVHS